MLSHLRVVVAIARGYLGYGLPTPDLIQEGNVGLMKGRQTFSTRIGRAPGFVRDPLDQGRDPRIQKNWRLVKIATTKAQRKLFFNLRSMKPSSSTLQGDEVIGGPAARRQARGSPRDGTRLSGADVASRRARTTTRSASPPSPIWPTPR